MKFEIDRKILIVIIIFAIMKKIDIYCIYLISIIFHELMHYIFSRIIKADVNYIRLGIFGMSMDVAFIGKTNFIKKIIFYLAGPCFNFFVACLFRNVNIKIAYLNFAIGIFNLLPIVPLDGGNIILVVLKRVFGVHFGYMITLVFSKCFLFILSFVYAVMLIKIKNIYLLLLIVYMWRLYFIEESKFLLFNRIVKCLKNVEKNEN